MNHRKVIIIGSGPAGHTAAIYTGKALLEPLMFEGFMAGGIAAGGQLTTTTVVENFPGFPEGIDGSQLMSQMRKQSLNSGAEIQTKTVESVDLKSEFDLMYLQLIAWLSRLELQQRECISQERSCFGRRGSLLVRFVMEGFQSLEIRGF